jgi:hypothetical protein
MWNKAEEVALNVKVPEQYWYIIQSNGAADREKQEKWNQGTKLADIEKI